MMGTQMALRLVTVVALQLSITILIISKSRAEEASGTEIGRLQFENAGIPDNQFLLQLYYEARFEQYLLPLPNVLTLLSKLVIVSSLKETFPLQSTDFQAIVRKIVSEAATDFSKVESELNRIKTTMAFVPASAKNAMAFLKTKSLVQVAFARISVKAVDDSANECISFAKLAYQAFEGLIKKLDKLKESLAANDMCKRGRLADTALHATAVNQKARFLKIIKDKAKYEFSEVSRPFEDGAKIDRALKNLPDRRNALLRDTVTISLLRSDATFCSEVFKLIRGTNRAVLSLREQFGQLMRLFETFSATTNIIRQETTANLFSSLKELKNDTKKANKFLNDDRTNSLIDWAVAALFNIRTASRYFQTLVHFYVHISETKIKIVNQLNEATNLQELPKFQVDSKLKELTRQREQLQKTIKALAEEYRGPFKKAVDKSKNKIREIFDALGPPLQDEDETI